MRGDTQRLVFSGVDVSLPSKVRGSEAEEEWQEVDWVSWSTGDLTVDGDSFLLAFKPSGGASGMKAKPLGSLIRASAVAQDEDNRALIVATSDALHRLYRLTFQSTRNAAEFTRLAESAEAAHAASADAKDGRSDEAAAAAAAAAAKLEAAIQEKLDGSSPLVFTGAELYGPDPGAQGGGGGTEVLLGRGAAVLLDPPEDSSKVGTYELLFYGEEEGAKEPLKRIQIGPKMTLKKQVVETEDEDAPAASYQLAAALQGMGAHTITFDSAGVGCSFARDFRVRQRLMDLSLKTVRRGRAAEELRGEIAGMRSRSLGARLWRLLCISLLLLSLAAAARLALLYRKDKGARPPAAYLQDLTADARAAAKLSRARVAGAGAKACELAFGSAPAADVRRCAALVDSPNSAVGRCLGALAGPA